MTSPAAEAAMRRAVDFKIIGLSTLGQRYAERRLALVVALKEVVSRILRTFAQATAPAVSVCPAFGLPRVKRRQVHVLAGRLLESF